MDDTPYTILHLHKKALIRVHVYLYTNENFGNIIVHLIFVNGKIEQIIFCEIYTIHQYFSLSKSYAIQYCHISVKSIN